MATATYRATPASSLNPAQSQVSAPVLEFRCLYTTDIHKKKKKWHDGNLKYHTFNKRVMVYDESRNLVGAMHYRESDELDSGTQLELDRPVLVDVAERLGTTNTDLTAVLGRPRQDGTNTRTQSTQPTRAMLPRINASNSQIKPKSIKDLLAASQGRMGRARLPMQSPFEERQVLAEIQQNVEPTAKRRKIDREPESRSITQKEVAPLPRPSSPLVNLSRQPECRPPIVDISSDEEPRTVEPQPHREPSSLASKERLAKPKEKKSRHNSAKVNQKDLKAKEPAISKDKCIRKQKPLPACNSEQPSARPVSAASTSSRSSAALSQAERRFPPAAPRSTLRLSTQRPRPRLMHRALLPTGATIARVGDQSVRTEGEASEPTAARSMADQPQRQRCTDVLDTDRFFALSQLQVGADLAANEGETNEVLHGYVNIADQGLPDDGITELGGPNAPSTGRDADLSDLQNSPLFMPRDLSQVTPFASQDFMIEDEQSDTLNIAEHLDIELEHAVDTVPEKTSEQDNEQGQEYHEPTIPSSPFMFSALQTSPVRSTVQAQEHATTAETSAQHLLPLPDNEDETSSVFHVQASIRNSRPFRRVVSESVPQKHAMDGDLYPKQHAASDGDVDLSIYAEADLGPGTPTYSIPSGPPSPQKATTLTVSSHASPVLKAAQLALTSHTAHLGERSEAEDVVTAAPPDVSPAIVDGPPPVVVDTGPWTTTEAFLLFDWWPSGRQKPDYGQRNDANNGRPNNVRPNGNDIAVGMSAHGMTKKYGTFGSARLVSQR